MEEEVESAAKSPGDQEVILGHNGVSEDSSSETSSYSESSSATMVLYQYWFISHLYLLASGKYSVLLYPQLTCY